VAFEELPSGVHGSLLSIIMAVTSQVLIEVPMPIRTPRLTIRPKEIGDGAITSAAVAETWEELNRWMRWAENRDAFTAELLEIRKRQVMASFLLRETIELIGIETQTDKAVVWCGFHDSTGKLANATPGIGFAKALNVKALLQRRPTRCYGTLSVRLVCSGLVSPTRAEMNQAVELPRDLGLISKGYSGGRTCCLAANGRTDTAMPVSTSPIYLI